MKTTRKYDGPCPDHPQIRYDCKHCNALRNRDISKYRPKQPEPEIYRGLHWPAPQL